MPRPPNLYALHHPSKTRCPAPRPHQPLIECGREFFQNSPNHIYCCDTCAIRAQRAKRSARKKTQHLKEQLSTLDLPSTVIEEPASLRPSAAPSQTSTIMDILFGEDTAGSDSEPPPNPKK